MPPLKTKRAAGLDIGQGAVKAVCLSRRRKKISIEATAVLDCYEEGLLSPEEVRAQLREWLQNSGFHDTPFVVGLPQYLATTQVSDFPEAGPRELEGMVAFETQQLAGLSEEAFIFGYHRLPPGHGRSNPILIGICRQSAVEDILSQIDPAGIQVLDLAMNGLAAANAYVYLYPEQAASEDPQLLLDIGAENSSLVVLADGHPVFVSSLLFGSRKFNQALAQHLKRSEDEVEAAKRSARVDMYDSASPLVQAARLLENEIRSSIEHWRSQEQSELGRKMFVRLSVCGGGAKLDGLVEFLAQVVGCETQLVGAPTGEDSDARDPALMAAFGLALQAIGAARAVISLATPDLRWTNRRLASFRYLAAAAVLTSILIVGGMFVWYRSLRREKAALAARMEELTRCEQLIPKIEDLDHQMEHREKMLLPFVDRGNRARRFLGAVSELARVRSKNDWFIYLADADYYEAGKKKDKEDDQKNSPSGPTGPALLGMGMPAPGLSSTGTADDSGLPDPYPVRITLPELRPLKAMVAAGYTRLIPHEPLKPVKRMIDRLESPEQGKPLFKGVDIFPESERDARPDIFIPWERLLRSISTPKGPRYKAFMLILPFAEQDVIVPEKKTSGERSG